tara:strand:+ start:13754 stop:14710 length:957 start_codon:yes stop_codon:yes gene_type:complete
MFVIVILIGSAWCSGVEAAFLAVNPIKIVKLSARKKPIKAAHKLIKLNRHLGRTLTVITISNNSFNIFGSLMVGSYAASLFNSGLAIPILSISFTILVLLLGEILPKAIGTKFSLQIALASSPILQFLTVLLQPFVILIERLLPVITTEKDIYTDEEEIRQMAKIGSQKGLIEADEAAMISKVFQLNDLKAKDLMIPRVSAPSINAKKILGDLKDILISNNNEWWVVLGEKVDKIKGVANRQKLLTALLEGKDDLTLNDLCEPVEYVPEMIKIDTLLTRFNNNEKGIKVVVDEFGGFVGLIQAESILPFLAGWDQEGK